MPVVAETQALQGLMAGLVALGLAASGWVAGGCTRQEVQEAGVEAAEAAEDWEVPVMVAGVSAEADCIRQAAPGAAARAAAGSEAPVTVVADCIRQEAQVAWGWEV